MRHPRLAAGEIMGAVTAGTGKCELPFATQTAKLLLLRPR